ncbi:hypothetical protein FUAX_07640 [Fulvitalea axinellae]|uniref:PKD domain-containing protein n=1 Tax=Fulvitalea axinellae TaxID=1182444 RepID=A0AAU9CSI5_9BACT|nr:hypothetical protein FUAX_07640 [Fulvitalea axinellae]
MRSTFIVCLLFVMSLAGYSQSQEHVPRKIWDFNPDSPNFTLDWNESSANADPDREFHISRVPLRNKVGYKPSQVNPQLDPKRKLSDWSGLSTSARGYDDSSEQAFTFWQYMDVRAEWSYASRVVMPSAMLTEAAHRNGTKSLGMLVWANNGWHGEEFREMHRKVNGVYIHARKLVDIARYYGFDGWSYNSEYVGSYTPSAEDQKGFLEEMQAYATSIGFDEFEILWYDARSNTGRVSFANQLNNGNKDFFHRRGKTVSDVYFCNYNWGTSTIATSINTARSFGRDPYDVAVGIYMPQGANNNWSNLSPYHKISIGLWDTGYEYAHLSSDPKRSMSFTQNEMLADMWTGTSHDVRNPGQPGTGTGKIPKTFGFSYYMPAKTAITQYPFLTRFNPGQGVSFSENGDRSFERVWSDWSLQDILPAWRWWWSQGGQGLEASIDFDEAFDGSASLRVKGNLSGDNTLRLYKVKLPVSADTKISVSYKKAGAAKGEEANAAFGFAFENGQQLSPFSFHSLGQILRPGWNTVEIDLSAYAGQTMAVIALKCSGTENNYDLRIGEILLTDGAVPVPEQPVAVSADVFENVGDKFSARLDWSLPGNPSTNEEAGIRYFEIRQVLSDGSSQLVGRSSARSFLVKNHQIAKGQTELNLKVISVGLDGRTANVNSLPVSQTLDPDPDANIDLDSHTLTQGIAYRMGNGSVASHAYAWTFEGADIAASADEEPEVIFSAPGQYKVKLTATHSDGQRVNSDSVIVTVNPSEGVTAPMAEFSASVTEALPGQNIEFDYTGDPGATYGPTSGMMVDSRSGQVVSDSKIDFSGTPFTISFWIKRDASHWGYTDFMSFGNFLSMKFKNGDAIQCYVIGLGPNADVKRSKTTPMPIPIGKWQHFAMTYDGFNTRLFLNGKKVIERVTSTSVFYREGTQGRLRLGNAADRASVSLDDIRFWKEARTETQLQQDMKVEATAPYSDKLAHYWKLNENTGVTSKDEKGGADLTAGPEIAWIQGSPRLRKAEVSAPDEIRYAWSFPGAYPEMSSEARPTVSYAKSGTYPVSLKVVTSAGTHEVSKNAYIHVADDGTVNLPPVVDFEIPANAKEETPVQFTAQASDPDGSVVAYAWDFGDNTGTTEANPTHTFATAGDYNVTLTVTDSDGETAHVSKTVTVSPDLTAEVVAQAGVVSVGETWTTVNLDESFSSMVVVTAPVTEPNASVAPFVVRIRNASNDSFQVKLQALGTGTVGTRSVHYLAVEEGDYTETEHGVKLSARKVISSQTAYKWYYLGKGVATDLSAFASPVVVGQVMTENDSRWSVFYADNGSLGTPTSASAYVGKHVGAGPETTRNAETLGFIVMETGADTNLDGLRLRAGTLSGVTGMVQTPAGSTQSLGWQEVQGAVLSVAGMAGSDGAWATLLNPGVSNGSMTVSLDEDQIADSERKHLGEAVAYIAFANDTSAPQLRTSTAKPSAEPLADNRITVWPNPATDVLNIQASGEFAYSIISQSGAVVLSGNGDSRESVNIGNLSTGIYILKVSSDSQVSVIRIMKN